MPKGLSVQEIEKHGLSARDVKTHQQRIIASLEKKTGGFIKIIDTWRLDNQGILPQVYLDHHDESAVDGFVSFVPAAGAASRYFQPLQQLRLALASKDESAIRLELSELRIQSAALWPLPEALAKLIESDAAVTDSSVVEAALAEIDSPKALLPHKRDGMSFLEKKCSEHKLIGGLIAEVYVAPLGYSQVFADHLQRPRASGNRHVFLEQGPSLSTLRFTRQGLPYRDEQNEVSLVPAGHGMLVRLFPEIKKRVPEAHSLFIRNIDNVVADEDVCVADTRTFLAQYQAVLESLQEIRRLLRDERFESAGLAAKTLRLRFAVHQNRAPAWLTTAAEGTAELWRLLLQIFHCPTALAQTLRAREGDYAALRRLFERPLNALGQVPNNGKDVGGSPVRVEHEGGDVTICLELPHASPEDRAKFLEDPTIATHFNPVFVAAEIPDDIAAYDLDQCPFWILAEKNIHGTSVVYHETVLYEVLGNSYTANVLFPEIPRPLFQPHKSLLDGLKK